MNAGKPWVMLAYAAVCCAVTGQVARSQEPDANVQEVLERVLAGRERIVSGHVRYRVGGVWQAGGEPMYSLVEGWLDGDRMRLDYWQRVDPDTGKTRDDGWLDLYVVGPSACATFVNGALMPDGKRGRGELTMSDTRVGLIPSGMSVNLAHLGLSKLTYMRNQLDPTFRGFLWPDNAVPRLVDDPNAAQQGLTVIEYEFTDRFRRRRLFVDPSKAYAIDRYSAHGGLSDGNVLWRTELEFEYKEHGPDTYYPVRARYRDWVKGKLTQDIEYTVLYADMNKPIDPAAFRIDGLNLADDVAVLDMTVGRTIGRIRDLRPGQAQSGLEALLAVDSQDPIKPLEPKEDPRVAACERKEARQGGRDSVAGAASSRVIFAWGALIGGLILLGCGVLLFRRRRGPA